MLEVRKEKCLADELLQRGEAQGAKLRVCCKAWDLAMPHRFRMRRMRVFEEMDSATGSLSHNCSKASRHATVL